MDKRATFLRMQDSTQADWQIIGGEFMQFASQLPARVIQHLQILQGDYGGFPVDRYTHSLQTATRALRDGRDEEYVVCALMHDTGDILGPANHAEIGAVIMKPYVSERNHWMLDKHGIFTFGETAKQAYDRMIHYVTLAEDHVRRNGRPPFTPAALPKTLATPAEIALR